MTIPRDLVYDYIISAMQAHALDEAPSVPMRNRVDYRVFYQSRVDEGMVVYVKIPKARNLRVEKLPPLYYSKGDEVDKHAVATPTAVLRFIQFYFPKPTS